MRFQNIKKTRNENLKIVNNLYRDDSALTYRDEIKQAQLESTPKYKREKHLLEALMRSGVVSKEREEMGPVKLSELKKSISTVETKIKKAVSRVQKEN